jgi:2-polyprenyl-6-methoxyphenol hydroxylase-like FAD-dependent oxidoreductase
MSANQDVDVTVVGAGPVGLALAAELALSGATVRVLERRTEPDETSKAMAINVPTAEALDRRGLLAAAEQVQAATLERVGPFAREADGPPPESGRRVPRFTGHFAGIVLDADLVDWSDPDLAAHTAVDGARMVPQPELERLLAEYLARLGVAVHRGVEVSALEDSGDGVLVGTADGTLRSGWLVGCDGGHSTVRRLAGIEFPGTDPQLSGLLAADVDIAGPEQLRQGWSWSSRGAYRYGPQPGRVATVEFDGAAAGRRAPVTLAELQASVRRVSGIDVTLRALRGPATRWSDNARQAATYRSGRVLLAGDAAHVHSPFSGQGLNLGIGDAMNLGWKLGAVIAGWAPAALLDSYDAERRPLGAWVLDWTRAQSGMMRGDATSAALRNVVADLLRTGDGATYAVKQLSGVAQRIDLPGEHPLVGRFVPDLWLRDGSRLVEHGHGGGFLLLDRTPDGAFARLASAWGGRVTPVPDVPGPDEHATPTGVLVRPDGVVAWAADSANPVGLEAALCQWAGVPAPV